MTDIHPTALVAADARLGPEVVVGPFAVIHGAVEVGAGTWIGSGTVIGAPPEIRGAEHGQWPAGNGFGVRIGAGVVIRESVQISAGSHRATDVADESYIMNQAYVAHDCVLGVGVVLSSGVRLAGHVEVRQGANLGMGATVHQRRVVGPLAMVGMGSAVTRDIPAGVIAFGAPARVSRINAIGLERAGFTASQIEAWAQLSSTSSADVLDLDDLRRLLG